MAGIHMIALDLDGTTLAPDSRLTPPTKETLERTLADGVQVVIATGRCYTAVPEEVLAIQGLRYVITSNGARIRDLVTGKDVYSDCLAPVAVERLVEVLEKHHHLTFATEIFVEGYAYIDGKTYQEALEGKDFQRSREYVLNTRQPVEDILSFALKHREEIENVSLFFEDMDERAEMHEALQVVTPATLTNSFPYNWELEGEHTNKGNALRFLMDHHGVDKAHLMACGDNPNDMAMLELAGIAVAMGNADVAVQEAADYVAPTNAEDGVAKAIQRYVWR